MSSVAENQFKKFQNTTRTFSSEEQFNLGMNYTNSPIEPGQLKVLLNFDIADDGFSLTPRAGFRTNKIAITNGGTYTKSGDQVLSSVMEETHNGITYKCVVTFNYDTKKLCIGTITNDTIDMLDNDFITENMVFEETDIIIKHTNHKDMSMHNIAIPQSINSCEQIGTLAWNNSYFFFGEQNSKTNLYNIVFDETTNKFKANIVNPTKLTALEASPNKFNMLLSEPYTFSNEIVPGAFVLQGMLCYQDNELVVSPKIKTTYEYRLNYTAPASAKYDIKWEWKDYNGTSWTELKKETITIGAETAPKISCEFSAPIKNSLMRVTVTGYSTEGTVNTYPDQVSAVAINCDAETQQSSANTKLKKYDLSKATGMCYWQNRLVLWGYEDPLIFVSETNLPEWFPYPNNIDLFEEQIIHCEPYLDKLLVFTTQKLFQLTMLSDGSGWTKTCIQDHLHLTEYDTNFIKTIKNMVFFKSGNSYFMVVPSSSTAAGLTIAPISKPIQWLLDNFRDDISSILKDAYGYQYSLTLIHCFNYINHIDIVTNYVFKDYRGVYINLLLLYDTEERTWRMHMFESESIYKMYRLDATTDGILTTLTVLKNNFENEIVDTLAVQFINRDINNPKDFYIPAEHIFNNNITARETLEKQQVYLNYQYFDTGFRALNEPNTKKRHREFQLRINNKAKKIIKFGTAFFIDEENRKNMYKYKVVREDNVNSPDYGVISVVPELQLDTTIHGETVLAELEQDINCWTLDSSSLPNIPPAKVRIAVSGKGYYHRLKFLSVNESSYELLGICWVYKYKNLR